MGGVGKTVMAVLVARDYGAPPTQKGSIWLTFGRQLDVPTEIQKALSVLGDDGSKYRSIPSARVQLRQDWKRKSVC